MKKYKIGNRIITANSPVEAVKVSKMLDSSVVKASMKDFRPNDVRVGLKFEYDGVKGQIVSSRRVEKCSEGFCMADVYYTAQMSNGKKFELNSDTFCEYYRRGRFNIIDSMKNSENSEIEYLTEEEERAVEDYRNAIAGTTNPKLLELYKHILDEELEHIKELQEADAKDSVKDSDKDSEMIDLHASYTTADYSGLKDYMKQNGLKAYYIYFDKQSENKAQHVARLLQQLRFKTDIVRNSVTAFGEVFDGYIKVTN